MHRHLSFALILILVGCARGDEAKEVLAVVLDHFSKESTASVKADDLILIGSRTRAWSEETLGRAEFDRERKCQPSQELYDAVLTNNRVEKEANALVADSDEWRIATQEDEAKGFMIIGDETHGKPVRTLVRVSLPGYSADGKEALVVLTFRWSIHTARARYVLSRKEGRWDVICSEQTISL